jgi:hypothetical protein
MKSSKSSSGSDLFPHQPAVDEKRASEEFVDLPFVRLDLSRDAVDLAEDLIAHVPALQEVQDEDIKADTEKDECL